jgi:hypothetical protein
MTHNGLAARKRCSAATDHCLEERDLWDILQTNHSALIPASLMIGHHFSISAF